MSISLLCVSNEFLQLPGSEDINPIVAFRTKLALTCAHCLLRPVGIRSNATVEALLRQLQDVYARPESLLPPMCIIDNRAHLNPELISNLRGAAAESLTEIIADGVLKLLSDDIDYSSVVYNRIPQGDALTNLRSHIKRTTCAVAFVSVASRREPAPSTPTSPASDVPSALSLSMEPLSPLALFGHSSSGSRELKAGTLKPDEYDFIAELQQAILRMRTAVTNLRLRDCLADVIRGLKKFEMYMIGADNIKLKSFSKDKRQAYFEIIDQQFLDSNCIYYYSQVVSEADAFETLQIDLHGVEKDDVDDFGNTGYVDRVCEFADAVVDSRISNLQHKTLLKCMFVINFQYKQQLPFTHLPQVAGPPDDFTDELYAFFHGEIINCLQEDTDPSLFSLDEALEYLSALHRDNSAKAVFELGHLSERIREVFRQQVVEAMSTAVDAKGLQALKPNNVNRVVENAIKAFDPIQAALNVDRYQQLTFKAYTPTTAMQLDKRNWKERYLPLKQRAHDMRRTCVTRYVPE